MEGSKAIQHLLRPTDTCVILVQGNLLGLAPTALRLIAIIKHEGTEEHALFLFDVDQHASPTTVKVESFYPIRGSFSTEVKVIGPSQCQVLLNNGAGFSLLLQLDYDARTAVFISQINKALHQFAQSSASNSSFSWLLGYQNCQTGWDRFAKPSAVDPMFRLPPDLFQLREGFPESWPWSHIITPNSDGSTDIANCEILMNFDPLHPSSVAPTSANPTVSAAPSLSLSLTSSTSSTISFTNSIVDHSNAGPFSESNPRNSTFHATDNVNPFLSTSPQSREGLGDTGLKHCISDTNLNQLKMEVMSVPGSDDGIERLMTRSEEDLTATGTRVGGATTTNVMPTRHCVAVSAKNVPSADKFSTEVDGGVEEEEGEDRLSQSQFFFKLEENKSLGYENKLSTSLSSLLRNQQQQHEQQHQQLQWQSHSSETSPISARRINLSSTNKQFLNTSNIKSSTSGPANLRSPELSRKHHRRTLNKSRDRSKSAAVEAGLGGRKSQWVSRFRPGVPVPVPGESARESIMQSELRHREKEFCSLQKIRVYCTTWNVNGRVPPFSLDLLLREFQVNDKIESFIPDVFAIGFQELDLSAQCLLNNDSNREDLWVDSVEQCLRHLGFYCKLCCTRLVGIMLLVYVKASLLPYVSDVETDQVATGMLGYMGNKGGVGVHFNLYHSSLCFVNSHLSAHMEEVDKRNHEYKQIMERMAFPMANFSYDIVHHDMIFWLGDLNYRITTSPDMTCEQVKANADAFQFPALLQLDQLLVEMKKDKVFGGFKEAPLDFKPTYKYNPNSDSWDSSEKHRAPAWCDRILCRGRDIQQLSYNSHPSFTISDHKPVSAIYYATLREVDPQKEKLILEHITWRLDKMENDTLPQVDLNVTEFHFRDVKFKIPQSRSLVVTNTGSHPVHISFIRKPDDKALTKEWLTVKPTSAVIHPMEDSWIDFTVLVDEDSAPPLTCGKEMMDDILVLHLEKGKDFFITISGQYLPSCFGSSLETLVNLHTYIREVPVARLVDLVSQQLETSSWDECVLDLKTPSSPAQDPPPLDMPKELFAIVDFIERNGIDMDGLFSDASRQSEIEEIMDMLDTGGKDLPGSVFSVASILLTFLSALADPVVPVSMHSRCMECCNNATLCKQALAQMPCVHRTTFIFMVQFMKKLVRHSEENGLDAKIIASLFGETLLRSPISERRTKSRRQLTSMKRKKATFLYHFIVNELTPT